MNSEKLMKTFLPVVSVAALCLLLPGVADAGECAVVDTARDTLSPSEQRAAQLLMTSALEEAGVAVSEAPCSEPWLVSHVRLGESVTVRMEKGGSVDQLSVLRLEELPAAYERLVRGIQTGQPATATADRNSVTIAEQAPMRQQADPLVYLQLGGGLTGFASPEGGTALGGGYRHSLDNFAIDVGLFHFILPGDIDNAEHFSMSLVELSGLYYFDGQAAKSLYAGGGLGLGTVFTDGDGDIGLQGQAFVGYELLRQSTIRLFPQLDVTVPMFAVDGAFIPSASLTLNVAFHPPQSAGNVPWWLLLLR